MISIVLKRIKDLIPYNNNPRDNDGAVEALANSIKEFGFKVPLVIDKDNVIVTGHTRLKAAESLELDKVPCIVADDLSDKQVQAFRLADNKVAELATWDTEALQQELEELEYDFNMEDFGFSEEDLEDDWEVKPDYKRQTQEAVCDILNLGYAAYAGTGSMDIPELEPVEEMPNVEEWISFNYVLTDDNPENKGVHFFIDDYQFERVWNNPNAYIDRLRKYKAVIAPDFSPYGDMPLATQIFNHYRKHWCAKYWQEHGVNVIPCIRASTDERFLDYYLQGEPKNSVVCTSSMWCSDEEARAYFVNKEFKLMMEKLQPKHVIIYGRPVDGVEGDFTYITNFTDKRFRADVNG